MTTISARAAVEILTVEECLTLLRGYSVGRLAVAVPDAAPLVVPVNYLVDGDVVVFRTDVGQKLSQLRQAKVSFQLDEIDYYHHTGWSVLVQGVAYEATHFEVDHLVLPTWAGGDKSHWVRIIPSAITGRRLVVPDLPRSTEGYL